MLRVLRWSIALIVICLTASLNWDYARAAPATVFTVVQNADATTLDPWNGGSNVTLGIERAFYEGLFGFDATMKLRPVLVKTWSVSADGLTYTLKLQTGVKFHDGTPFNAAAVKVNLDRVLNPANHLQKYGLYHTVSHIESVKVVADDTVDLVLSNPSGILLNNLAHPSGGMISPAALAKYGDKGIASHPVGTGPFVFDNWVHGDRIVATRNPNYWRTGEPGVDQIVFRNVPDSTQAIAMLRTGEAQFVFPIDPVNVKPLMGQPGVKVVSAPSIFVTYLTMNVRHAPFNKIGVRTAMNYAVNKRALISALYLGYAKEMHSMIGSQLAGYVPVGTYAFDVAKAKKLLAENGYPQGFTASLWVPNDTFSQKQAVFVQQQLSQIGVKINITPMESGTYDSLVNQGVDKNKGQLVLYGFSPSDGAAGWALRAELTTAAWPPNLFNVSFYSNPKVDSLLVDSERTTDATQRNADYRQTQEIVFREAPWVWLAEPTNVWGMNDKVSEAYVLPDQTVQVQYARMR